ncbi:MAG: DEAD/DEAH box helicase family protein [Alicyclobacillus mali]|uniref:helicase C-terminal domain-containing protein n=1 Tax=Alicyclobacillus mali (ex Roth et al. 2021) TaxID=1123961 RepID=UPI0023F0A0D4|nr:helicase C-terminal domain-containing protein [Alicyclobacillus mali (ex Roth et al. 2021)]MCL6487415.1 DEAD/DEAH box helicase family protein [Alicyclobacillus mali (ex Roth et al. 2021)]
MEWIIVDLETTGLEPERGEILEIGALRVCDHDIVDTFHTLVTPERPIPDEISRLTGLSASALAGAPLEREALMRFAAFVGDTPMAGHNWAFERSFLRHRAAQYHLPLEPGDGLCTLTLARILAPRLMSHRLEYLARRLRLRAEVSHRALADAHTTHQLLTRLEEKARRLPEGVIELLAGLAGLYSPLTAAWFEEVLRRHQGHHGPELEERQGLYYTKPNMPLRPEERSTSMPNRAQLDEIASKAREVLAPGGPLAASMPGFEARPGQLAMVDAVAEALAEGKHAMVEAGTGTGKSLAYLVPAALLAMKTGDPVVVSTHTLSLQDQIAERDFPLLRRIFGEDLRLVVQKGRNNYVCLRKVRSEARLSTMATPVDEIQGVMALLVWLTETPDGTRETLSKSSVGVGLWARVRSESESCINRRCPFFQPCYYFRTKQAAQAAHLIVTNHSLVMSDLASDHRVLPKYEHLVVDEAHHLEEQATSHLGFEVQSGGMAALAHRLVRDRGRAGVLADVMRMLEELHIEGSTLDLLEEAKEWVGTVSADVDAAFQALAAQVPTGQSEFRLDASWRQSASFQAYREALDKTQAGVKRLHDLRARLVELVKSLPSDDHVGRVVDAAGFLGSWLDGIARMQEVLDESPDDVTWVEVQAGGSRTRVSVHRAPVDVARVLKQHLFDPLRSVILTSATLAVNGAFDFTIRKLGLDEHAREDRVIARTVPSPFAMERQARLFVPNDVPDIAAAPPEEAAAWLTASISSLAEVSNGRMLVLFTSHALLRETARLARSVLAERGLNLLAQDLDGSRAALLEAFRAHPESVMFGAQTFWEGIDLPGDQLTALVIVRLPFAPPTHPVTAARLERLEASGQNAFRALSLPEAVVRFRQGVGRLIRTQQDRGVIVVFDKRIVTQRYGSMFWKSIPGLRPRAVPERDLVAEVRKFLQSTPSSSEHGVRASLSP